MGNARGSTKSPRQTRDRRNEMKKIIHLLEKEIALLNEAKKDYYSEGNGTDTYVMSLVGKVEGLNEAIRIIENN
jgi:hypothetical protein